MNYFYLYCYCCIFYCFTQGRWEQIITAGAKYTYVSIYLIDFYKIVVAIILFILFSLVLFFQVNKRCSWPKNGTHSNEFSWGSGWGTRGELQFSASCPSHWSLFWKLFINTDWVCSNPYSAIVIMHKMVA